MTLAMAEEFLDCCQGDGEAYKKIVVLGEMRCQQITNRLRRQRLYNRVPDPLTSPLFRVH